MKHFHAGSFRLGTGRLLFLTTTRAVGGRGAVLVGGLSDRRDAAEVCFSRRRPPTAFPRVCWTPAAWLPFETTVACLESLRWLLPHGWIRPASPAQICMLKNDLFSICT